jgi:IS30 family transposase
VAARDIDWPRYDQLKAQGRSGRQIAQDMGVAESTLRGALKRRQTPRALPVQRPVQSTDTGAVQTIDTGAVQRIN